MHDPHTVNQLRHSLLEHLPRLFRVFPCFFCEVLLEVDETVTKGVKEVRLEVVRVVFPDELDDDGDGVCDGGDGGVEGGELGRG